MIVNPWFEFGLFLITMPIIVYMHEFGHYIVLSFFDNKAKIKLDKKGLYTTARVNNTLYLASLYNGVFVGAIVTTMFVLWALIHGYVLYPLFVTMAYVLGVSNDVKEIKAIKGLNL